MSLGSRINEIRKEKKISIDDLCARSGVPKGTLSKITAGITTNPTLDTVQAIARALGCRLDDFDEKPLLSEKTLFNLSTDEMTHIKKYRTLDEYGKEAVDSVLYVEYKRCMSASDNAPSLAFAARRSDESHAIIGPDTDVEI